VPGIGFAPPRICIRAPASINTKRCLLICRSDDIVTDVPAGFNHLGDVRMLQVQASAVPKHRPKHYTALLPQLIRDGKLPKQWP